MPFGRVVFGANFEPEKRICKGLSQLENSRRDLSFLRGQRWGGCCSLTPTSCASSKAQSQDCGKAQATESAPLNWS